MLAGFVGEAALIGPAIKGLNPDVDFSADTRYRRELAVAIDGLRDAINQPPPYRPPRDDDGDVALPQDGPESESDDYPPVDDAVLNGLTADSIHRKALRKVQAAIAEKLAAVEAAQIHAELITRGKLAAAARMKDRWQQGASAWLNAT